MFIYKFSIKCLIFRNLPWIFGYPTDSFEYPIIVLKADTNKKFRNVKMDHKACLVCMVLRTTIFTMRGICDDSYIGTHQNYEYLLFNI